jgi:DNA-binding LytR/AlgR family response regulator
MSTITKLNCIIVDDEPLALSVLSAHIASISALHIVQQCNNAMEAFEALHKNKIDLLFLDINMPIVSGLSFLRSLKNPPSVIITTAYTEYAMDGYELDVVDYLLKPISLDRLQKAVNKVIIKNNGNSENEMLENNSNQNAVNIAPVVPDKNYFFIKANGKLVKINFADIKYIEGMKDYLKIFTVGQTIVTHQTMKSMEELLPSNLFMRVHKSYIIALHAIKSIDGNNILLDMERAEVPLGSSYKDALMQVIQGY